MEFGVLGTVEYWQDGAATPIGGPKQRAVLAMLLRDAGRVVSSDAMINGVWGDDAAPSTRSSLHTYISNLRVALQTPIDRTGSGYRLEVEPSAVDANVFLEMTADAHAMLGNDPAQASELLRRALALWRGRPYADLIDTPGLQDEIRRLEELRLLAVEDRIDADLALGRHALVVGELEALVAQHPFREGLRARHMLALYRNGRQAEALRAFERTRRHLLEELGVDPSPELQRLEKEILTHDPQLLTEASRTEVVALLFTDIEGSTSLWETKPAAMQRSLAAHDEIVRRAVGDAGGKIFKRTGDGVLSVFAGVVEAASAAEAIQRELVNREWGETGPIWVGMSIDVGEVDARGGDYFGPPMNRNSRLLDAAHGGQIVLSEPATDALRGQPGVQIRSLGEYRFKGLATPQRVFQLVVRGLDQDFPDLRVDASGSSSEMRHFGDAIKGYELRERIGVSDTAVVYRAYQPTVGRQVAIKVIRAAIAGHPLFVKWFEPRARMAAKLAHPHIVPLFDFWRDHEGAYLVMPYLSGRDLSHPHYGALGNQRVVEIVAQIGAALSYAHRQGVVHGNLQPANVLFDDDGNSYLTDFGLAPRTVTPASSGSPNGSPYVPLESVDPDRVEGRSDVYGLAALAARMILGEDPADSAIESLSDPAGAVIRMAMSPDPGQRHESVEAFISALVAALDGVVGETPTDSIRNPYKGLAAFDEADARDFFGRSEEVESLLRMVSNDRMATVVGPSGSGKSSLVRSGLVPKVRSGGDEQGGSWLVVAMVPGRYPFDEMATALSTLATDSLGDLAAELRSDERGLLRVTKRIAQDHHAELLVVIDQLEELYSLTDDERLAESFASSIVTAIEDPHASLRVVATIRADFFDRPLIDEELGPVVSRSHLALTIPRRDQLLEAVTEPARAVGISFEAGLPERIVDDIAGEPGGLPLMQFLLTEMAERADGGRITWSTYQQLGGVSGALSRRADEVLGGLDASEQDVVRQIFLRLVNVTEDADDVRRRVRRTELEEMGFDPGSVERVLQSFGAARLLTFDRDPVTRGPTVEVAHESLIREWKQLTDWLAEARDLLVVRRRFDLSMAEWEGSGGVDDLLPTRGRLAQYEEWAEHPGLVLTAGERRFLDRAVEHRAVEEERARTRRRAVVATLATAAIVAIVLAGVAWVQATRASAGELIAQAESNLAVDPELSILLALEAAERYDRFGSVPTSVSQVLREAMDANRVVERLPHGSAVAASADGSVLVTADPDEATAVVWDAETFERLATLESVGEARINYVWPRAIPGEMFIGLVLPDGTREVRSWAVGDDALGELLSSDDFRAEVALWFDVSPDGRLVAEGTDGQLLVRDRNSGQELYATSIALSTFRFADEDSLALLQRDVDPQLVVVDARTGEEELRLGVGEAVLEAIFAEPEPNGTRIAVVSASGEVAMVDTVEGDIVWRVDLTRGYRPAWLPDGGLLVGGEGVPVVLDAATGETRFALPGHRGGALEYGSIPGTDFAVSASLEGGQTIIHDLASVSPAVRAEIQVPIEMPIGLLEVDDQGLVGLRGRADVGVADSTTGESIVELEGSPADVPADTNDFPAISTDVDLLAYNDDGRSRLWSVEQRAIVYTAPVGYSIRGISTDGHAVVSRSDVARVIDIASGDIVAEIETGPNVAFATFSPDGRYLITTSQQGGNPDYEPLFRVWDRTDHRMVAGFGAEPSIAWMVALTPDGRRAVTAGAEGTIYVYDFERLLEGAEDDEALLDTIDAHNGFMPAIDISPSGRMLVSTAWNEPAKLWNLDSGQLLGTFGTANPAIGFHPQHNWLYTAEQGTLRVHSLDAEELLRLARSALTRDFTPGECETFLHRSCDA